MSSETYKSSFEGTFSILRPSDFVKENAAMKGSVFMVDGTDILGVMIYEYGEIWTVNIDDSTVRFKTVFVCYENGKPAVAERIYSHSGDEGNVPSNKVSLMGTWNSVNRYYISEDGTFTQLTNNYSLTIDNQNKGFCLGTWSENYTVGTISLALTEITDRTHITMCLTWGEDNVSYSFGWAVDDTHIIIFETYEDSYGSTITVGTLLELSE
ncbi:MAG: hypothetical protein WCR17_00485 [Candidatus Methanomethylophilaceae archaeon]